VSPIEVVTKPVKCFNCKTKDSRFLKMDDSLIAEALSMFTALPVLPTVVLPEPSVNLAAIVKADVRKSPPAMGLLRQGFLGPSSSAVPVDPQPTPDGSVGVLSSALVVRDVSSPVTLLDWALSSVKNVCPVVGVSGDEDQTVALLTAIGEDNLWEVKEACSSSRGKRKLLIL
jgi:hypothetical protein